MDGNSRDSGFFPPIEPEQKLQPEAVLVGGAWVLAVVQTAVAIGRGGAFGSDGGVALAFALVVPLVARHQVTAIARRASRAFRTRRA